MVIISRGSKEESPPPENTTHRDYGASIVICYSTPASLFLHSIVQPTAGYMYHFYLCDPIHD